MGAHKVLKMVENNHVFKDAEINKVLEWWITQYGYKLTDREDGLFIEDLQEEELSEYTTEEKVINFFIEQIEGKMHIAEDNIFIEDLQVLKKYRVEK